MPNTVNVALEVPTTGSLVGTWGSAAVNPDFVAIDGLIAGVQTISVSNAPLTLSAPAGALTPGPGPFQSQNRVLVFTGTLTGHVQITFPLPGVYEVFNNTTGNFILSFRAVGSGNIIAVPQGALMPTYNDGTNCALIKNLAPGTMLFIAGETALPVWAASCTVRPFLLCDGSIFNFSDYGALGRKFGSAFGGNGITTAAVPDLRGRNPLAYDGTGTRITVAGGAGFSGQTIGAAGGAQGSSLAASNMVSFTASGSVSVSQPSFTDPLAYFGVLGTDGITKTALLANIGGAGGIATVASASAGVVGTPSASFSGANNGGTSAIFSNVPPGQVAGSWFVVT